MSSPVTQALVAAAVALVAPFAHACGNSQSVPLTEVERTNAYSALEYPMVGSQISNASLKAELKVTPQIKALVAESLRAGCQQRIEWDESAGYDLYLDEFKDAFATYSSTSQVALRFKNGSERLLQPAFSTLGRGISLSASDRAEHLRSVVLSKAALRQLQERATLVVTGQAETHAYIGDSAWGEYSYAFFNFDSVPRLVIQLP